MDRANIQANAGLAFIAFLLAVITGPADAVCDPVIAADRTPVFAAILAHPPEVRRLPTFPWKSFVPAKPAVMILRFRHPEPDLSREETCHFTLPELALDLPEQPGNLPDEPGNDTLPQNDEAFPPMSRITDNRISLKEEMRTLDDLDTGKSGGMTVPGAGGERELRGFLRIPSVWGAQLHVPDSLKRASISLTEAMNRYSGIRAESSPHLYLSSERIFRMPFLFITTDTAFELTPIERHNFAEYLKNGGFAFIDNGTPQYENGAAEMSLRQMVRDSLGSRAHFEPLPVNHPLYHCRFDFADGPPQGDETREMQNTNTTGMCGGLAGSNKMLKPVFYLEGVFLDGQLVAVYSNKGYSQKWSRPSSYYSDNTPQLKMGVNLVVYALTREMGMNVQHMARYTDIP